MSDDPKKKKNEESKAPQAEKPDVKSSKKQKEPKGRRSLWRSLFICSEIAAVLLLIVAILMGLSVWRLTSGPVDISFSKDYIETALRDEESGLYAKFEEAALYWPELKGPLFLGIKDGRIFNEEDREIIHVDEIALSLSKAKLILGQIEPLALSIQQPSLRIIRNVDNTIDFGFGTIDTLATETIEEQADEQKDLIADILNMIKQQEAAQESSPLASLKSFEIQDARTIIEDHTLEATWFVPDFDIRFETIQEGLKTEFGVQLPAPEGKQSFIKAIMTLNEATSTADLELDIQNLDTQIFAGKFDTLDILDQQNIIMSGKAKGILDKGFNPLLIEAAFNSSKGEIVHDMLSKEPIPYRDFKISAVYNNQEIEKLSLQALEMTLHDVTIRGSGNLGKKADQVDDGYFGDVEVTIDDMPHSALEPIWPEFLVGDNSEEWLIKKMSGGNLSGLRAEADLHIFQDELEEWDADISGLMAYFAFSNMSMDYRNPLPPVTKANGSGVFNLDTDIMTIDIEKAELNGLAVSKTGLTFKDVAAEGKGDLEMSIQLNGSLRSVFEYISIEPIGLKDELDMDITQVKGDTDLLVEMSFPTKADLDIEEIKMNISGNVRNGFLPDVLEGLPVEGGPFAVNVNNERYTVKGNGTFSGRPVDVDWFEYLNSKGKDFKSRAKISITIDEELRRHFGIDLTEFLEGSVPTNLVYTSLPNSKATIVIEADATPATVFIEPFDYSKAPGQKGLASMTAHLDNNILRRISNLNGTANNFDLKNTTLFFTGSGNQTALTQARIERFTIGETIAGATIDIAPSGAMKILMEGAFLDLRPFVDDNEDEMKEEYDGPPQVISVSVDQMRTADDQTVQYAKLYADIDNKGRFNQLEMDAIAGSGDIYMRYKPDAQGRRTFRFEADDAGAALKAFDVYPSIIGGKLVIYGEPISGVYDRNLVGVAQITDFKVVDAPSLARLLGALSLTGVTQLLNNEGLSFSKLEAGFDWLYRPQGALLVLKDGRTSGNSLGLTFDGVFDNAAMTVDVSGTIIPLSGINKAISSIPLIGDILSGGSGAIFAATYSMQGKTEDPQVLVNPLSVLTPGILRRILFE